MIVLYLMFSRESFSSSDDGRIAYSTRLEDKTSQIRIYDVATEEDSLVMSDETYKFWYSWSPDQRQIIFQRDFHPPKSHIFMVDINGDNLQPIVTDTTSRNWTPDLSPDGQKIAFSSDRSGVFNIYVVNLDGTNLTKLTDIDGSAPRWSPDGNQIAFQAYVDGNFEIYVMDADGSKQTNLTKHPASDMTPSWSPDGKHISFTSDRDSKDEKGDIFIMNVDGSEILNVTQHPAEDNNATWSPGGNVVAFISNRDGNSKLYMVNLSDLSVTQVPVFSDEASSPKWSRK